MAVKVVLVGKLVLLSVPMASSTTRGTIRFKHVTINSTRVKVKMYKQGYQPTVRNTSSCGSFNIISNLQLGPFLGYRKSGKMPQILQHGITVVD
jgi:hypothetical protein